MIIVETKKGDSLKAIFYFIKDGSPANLSGCSALMHARHSRTNALILSASTSDGRLTVDGVAGTVTVNVPAFLMSEIPSDHYIADVQLTYLNGDVKSSEDFTVYVKPDYTYS